MQFFSIYQTLCGSSSYVNKIEIYRFLMIPSHRLPLRPWPINPKYVTRSTHTHQIEHVHPPVPSSPPFHNHSELATQYLWRHPHEQTSFRSPIPLEHSINRRWPHPHSFSSHRFIRRLHFNPLFPIPPLSAHVEFQCGHEPSELSPQGMHTQRLRR